MTTTKQSHRLGLIRPDPDSCLPQRCPAWRWNTAIYVNDPNCGKQTGVQLFRQAMAQTYPRPLAPADILSWSRVRSRPRWRLDRACHPNTKLDIPRICSVRVKR
jgi:hypothetical protein